MGFDKRANAKAYALKDGDTLQKIAEREAAAGNKLTGQDIARFNWGTDKPDEVNRFLRDELGCYKRDDANGFVVSAAAKAKGKLLIPVKFKASNLALTKTHTLKVKKQPPPPEQFRGCVMVKGICFEFDSSFIRPSVVDDLKRLEQELKKHADGKVMIFGHTDKVGPDDYNKGLSERRARSVYAFITNDADEWEKLYNDPKEKWGLKVVQTILKDLGHDPGPIDGIMGDRTHQAIKSFDPASSDNTPDLRKKLFQAYMTDKHDVKIEPGQFMDPKHMGCSEFNPVVYAKGRCERNRRVVFFIFHKDRLPTLPCKEADLAPCHQQTSQPHPPRFQPNFRCSFYDSISRDCPCEQPVPSGKLYDLSNVRSPPHIAPQKEKIKIEYDVVNQGNSSITSGKLEIFRKQDNTLLKSFDLKPEQCTEGHHDDFEWDGAVDTNAEFPDGFVTIEHSDYVAKVTVTGDTGDKTGTTEIKVELKDFKVELAPKAMLKDDRDKEVYDQVGAIPAASLVQVKLRSNLYTVDAGTDEKTTQAAYTEYQNLWGGGPRIPLHATATVLDSKGNEVRCGVAMGRARVLWDFEDPAQTEPAYHATALAPPPPTNQSNGAKPFIDKALNYDKAATRPKNGDNCHLDRGGRRTSSSGPPLFHGSDVGTQNFPFSVDKGKTRWWGCFSRFEVSGDDDGRTGAIFRPTRMAGDNYKVTAYLDLSEKLDVTDDIPPGALRTVKVGDFEIWRLIHLGEHFKKGAQVTGVMPGFAEYYQDGFVEVKDDRGGVKDMTQADYDTEFQAAFNSAGGNVLVRNYGLAPGSQWDAPVPTGAVPPPARAPNVFIATFLPYNQFKAAVSTGEGKAGASLQNFLNINNCGDSKAYANQVQDLCISIAIQFIRPKSTKEGITVVQFGGTSNLEGQSDFPLNGLAVSKTSAAERHLAGFLLCQTNAQAAQTPAHEIGHLTFLPHSPRINEKSPPNVINAGGGITPDFHDVQNLNCLMSYARPRPGFCGLCLLRLRGWKGDEFDRNGPKTAK